MHVQRSPDCNTLPFTSHVERKNVVPEIHYDEHQTTGDQSRRRQEKTVGSQCSITSM